VILSLSFVSTAMDFDRLLPFRLPIKILTTFGLWQKKSSSRFYKVYGLLMHLTFISLATLCMLLYIHKVKTVKDMTDFLVFTPTYVVIFIKSIVYISKVEKIEALLVEMEELLPQEALSAEAKKQLEGIARILKIFLALISIAVTFSDIGAFMNHELVYKLWLPFDIQDNQLSYNIVFAQVSICTIGFCLVGASLDMFPAFLIAYVTILLENLCKKLTEKLIHSGSKKKMHENLLECIEEHRKIRQLVRGIEEINSQILLIQGLVSSIVLCTISFTLSLVSN